MAIVTLAAEEIFRTTLDEVHEHTQEDDLYPEWATEDLAEDTEDTEGTTTVADQAEALFSRVTTVEDQAREAISKIIITVETMAEAKDEVLLDELVEDQIKKHITMI